MATMTSHLDESVQSAQHACSVCRKAPGKHGCRVGDMVCCGRMRAAWR